ncbi:MAG: DsbA family protein [Rickettsiales bacterium]|jgi:protein-disulfide isomerase|nr:DsbA family protein [Rickettsiales bacterium]
MKDIILNPQGTVEVLEFIDYNCGHCKRQFVINEKLLKDNKNVKLVVKPIPILGEHSMYATQIGYAILFIDEGAFLSYFDSIMRNITYTSENPIIKAIKDSNLTTEQIEKTLRDRSSDIEKIIKQNESDAESFGVQGTPAFVIDGQMIAGEVSLKDFKNYLGDL